jgi:hypothetical protein
MKIKLVSKLVLSILIIWSGTAMAIDSAKIGKVKLITHVTPISQHQAGPQDSVLIIKGKIDMGTTDYYSVEPVFVNEWIYIDGEPVPSMGFFNSAALVPQFKSSASAGWTIYLYVITGLSPSYWEVFQTMGIVTLKSSGSVKVKYHKYGTPETISVTPGQGVKTSKIIGPMQSK